MLSIVKSRPAVADRYICMLGSTFYMRDGRVLFSVIEHSCSSRRATTMTTHWIIYIIQTMRALNILKYGRQPSLVSVQLPAPTHQKSYLIKMAYAPVNPSDINFFLGSYGIRKQGFPIVGFEGSGVIIDSLGDGLEGKKVSVLANKQNGTHATHIRSYPHEIIVWPESASLKEISMGWINPLSCIGMSQIIFKEEAQTAVISAAASSVGRSLISYLRMKGYTGCIVGITRSDQHDDQMVDLGANTLLRVDDLEGMKKAILGKSVFLDCVGGQFAGQVFNLLPIDSMMVCYGRLSKQNLGGVDLGQLYFFNKRIQGFWLNTFMSKLTPAALQQLKKEQIQNSNLFVQKVRATYKLEDFKEAYHDSLRNQSEGKILLDLE